MLLGAGEHDGEEVNWWKRDDKSVLVELDVLIDTAVN